MITPPTIGDEVRFERGGAVYEGRVIGQIRRTLIVSCDGMPLEAECREVEYASAGAYVRGLLRDWAALGVVAGILVWDWAKEAWGKR